MMKDPKKIGIFQENSYRWNTLGCCLIRRRQGHNTTSNHSGLGANGGRKWEQVER